MTLVPMLRAALRGIRAWLDRFWREFVNAIASSATAPDAIRLGMLRLYGLNLATCRIEPGSWFGGSDITIGDGSFINRGCVFDNSAAIRIGRSCSVGMAVTFVTSDHEIGPPDRRAGAIFGGPIVIGDGAWVGTRATLLAGAVVGAGCVVAAGSLVRGECEPNCLYAGIPACKIRALAGASDAG